MNGGPPVAAGLARAGRSPDDRALDKQPRLALQPLPRPGLDEHPLAGRVVGRLEAAGRDRVRRLAGDSGRPARCRPAARCRRRLSDRSHGWSSPRRSLQLGLGRHGVVDDRRRLRRTPTGAAVGGGQLGGAAALSGSGAGGSAASGSGGALRNSASLAGSGSSSSSDQRPDPIRQPVPSIATVGPPGPLDRAPVVAARRARITVEGPLDHDRAAAAGRRVGPGHRHAGPFALQRLVDQRPDIFLVRIRLGGDPLRPDAHQEAGRRHGQDHAPAAIEADARRVLPTRLRSARTRQHCTKSPMVVGGPDALPGQHTAACPHASLPISHEGNRLNQACQNATASAT